MIEQQSWDKMVPLQAVQDVPPGQRPAVVRFVAATVQKVFQARVTGSALAALTPLLQGTLKGWLSPQT